MAGIWASSEITCGYLGGQQAANTRLSTQRAVRLIPAQPAHLTCLFVVVVVVVVVAILRRKKAVARVKTDHVPRGPETEHTTGGAKKNRLSGS